MFLLTCWDMTTALQEQTASVPPLSVRIIAKLDIFVKTPIVLLGASSAAWHHSPGLLLGFLIPSRFAQPLFVLLAAGSFILAIGILRKKAWGLDGLVAYCLLGLVNAPVVLLSRARLTYEGVQAQRLIVDSRISMQTAMKLQQIISISIYAVAFTISAIFLYFLLTRRRAFRDICEASAHASR